MWAKFMETKNGYTAQIWKDLFNNCAVSVRVVPHGQSGGIPADLEPCDIYVPWGKLHVAEEIVRKS
jgi:hypothetical protein